MEPVKEQLSFSKQIIGSQKTFHGRHGFPWLPWHQSWLAMAWAVEKLSSSQDEFVLGPVPKTIISSKTNCVAQGLVAHGDPGNVLVAHGICGSGTAAMGLQPSCCMAEPKRVCFRTGSKTNYRFQNKQCRGHGNQWAGPALAMAFHAEG